MKPWQSKLGNPWVILFVFVLLILTILKLNSHCTIIDCETVMDKTRVHYDFVDLLLYGLWLIGPPTIFLYEYVYLFGKVRERRLDEKEVADLKYCHELAGKIWAGVSVFLGILLLVRHGIKL